MRKQSKASLIIVIPNYRTPSRNKTVTSHWRNYMRYRDELAELITAYCQDRRLFKCAKVTIAAYYTGKRRRDVSNIDDKMVLDALMKIGVLEDDDTKHNPQITKIAYIDCLTDELHIIVEEYEKIRTPSNH